MKHLLSQLLPITYLLAAFGCNSSTDDAPVPPLDYLLTVAETTLYHPYSALKTTESPVTYPTVNGIPFYPVNTTKVTYEYDPLGRLTKRTGTDTQYTGAPLASYSEAEYSYSENTVQRTSLTLSPITFHLNSFGYIAENNTFDDEGYLTRSEDEYATTVQTIKNGNCIHRVYENKNQLITTTFEYDLTRRGPIDPLSLESGKPNRNLVVKSIQVVQWKSADMSNESDTIVTQFEYSYNLNGMIDQRSAFIEAFRSSDPQHKNQSITLTRFNYVGIPAIHSL